MDLSRIKIAVLNELKNVNSLNSLKIQNHIYGCYVIMEDISQGRIRISDMNLIISKLKFNLDTQFAEIGFRFGFMSDTHLYLDSYQPEYKNAWLATFTELAQINSLEKSDAIEDAINEIIVREIAPTNAFFLNALDGGMLPYDWLDRAFFVITNPTINLTSDTSSSEDDIPVENTAISHAHTEKAILHVEKHKRQYLAETLRHKEHIGHRKKLFDTTRRNLKTK